MRVRIKMARTSGSPVVRVAAVNVRPQVDYGSTRVIQGSLSFDGSYGLGWWDGVTVDTALIYISGSNGRLRLYRPLGGGAGGSLWIDNTNDASLTSTNHGLTIGPHSGSNIKIDGNEILSVNNEAAASLFINQDSDTYISGDTANGVWFTAAHNVVIQNGFLQIMSQSAPGTPASGGARIYVDTSAGKERIRAVFDDGSRVTIVAQP